VFSDHSLVTDASFGEMQLISCRNVLIYFDRELQDRVVALFRDRWRARASLASAPRKACASRAMPHRFRRSCRRENLPEGQG
jgi:chemotaxis protein methyltransferase CheR